MERQRNRSSDGASGKRLLAVVLLKGIYQAFCICERAKPVHYVPTPKIHDPWEFWRARRVTIVSVFSISR
jgi:hypothetical protein